MGSTSVYAAAFCGAGIPFSQREATPRLREAGAFASYVYDRRFNDDGVAAGGLLKTLRIRYSPSNGLQAALFKGDSGTFYLAARGTELFSWSDWITDVSMHFYGRSPAYDDFINLSRATHSAISDLGGVLVITGQSMGGGMAIAGSHETGAAAEAFNPAYVSPAYLTGQSRQIEINVTQGEPLDLLRRASGLPPQGNLNYFTPVPGGGMKHGMGHFPKLQ